MGFRFQKRVRLLPGVTLNFSKRGISTSLGVRGARITRGHGKSRVTMGIPGTGVSYTSVSRSKPRPRAAPQPRLSMRRVLGALVIIGVCFVLSTIVTAVLR